MEANEFFRVLDADFYTGVPDSLLKPFVHVLMTKYGNDPHHHVIAANEGNAAAVAAGHYLATGRVPVVYLQNSGEGNLVNPAASLLHRMVYGIPVIFVIGWRGEPGTQDEPQHMEQGKITLPLLELLDIPHVIIGKGTTVQDVQAAMDSFRSTLTQGGDVAFVVSKGALTTNRMVTYRNTYTLRREDILRHILRVAQDDFLVVTTGKASREIFELREERGEDHAHDFLTVGSMGHASSIALGLSLAQPGRRIWCIDGDGAALMHLGAMAVIGNAHPKNFCHVLINNEAHESVGGFPTAAGSMDLPLVARGCHYAIATRTESLESLDIALERLKHADGPAFLEIRSAIGSRKNLGRPTRSPVENRQDFMQACRISNIEFV